MTTVIPDPETMMTPAPFDPISMELYLEGIPTAFLEREALRRALEKGEANYKAALTQIAHLAEKNLARKEELARLDALLEKGTAK